MNLCRKPEIQNGLPKSPKSSQSKILNYVYFIMC